MLRAVPVSLQLPEEQLEQTMALFRRDAQASLLLLARLRVSPQLTRFPNESLVLGVTRDHLQQQGAEMLSRARYSDTDISSQPVDKEPGLEKIPHERSKGSLCKNKASSCHELIFPSQ